MGQRNGTLVRHYISSPGVISRDAHASLRDYKQEDNHSFKFWAQGGGGPDESGVPGYIGGPKLDAGSSYVTLREWAEGYAGEPASAAGSSCVTPGLQAAGVHGFKFLAEDNGRPDESGVFRRARARRGALVRHSWRKVQRIRRLVRSCSGTLMHHSGRI